MPMETVSFLECDSEAASGDDESSYEQAHGQHRGNMPGPARAGIALVLGAMMLLGLAWPATHHGMSLNAAGTIGMSYKPESAFLGSEDILKEAKSVMKKIPHASLPQKEEMKIEWAAMLASLDDAGSQYAAGKKMMERQFDKASAKDLKELGLPPHATKEQIMAVPQIKRAFADFDVTLETIQKCTEATKTVLKALDGKAASAVETPGGGPAETSSKPESAFQGSEDILKKATSDTKKIPHASQSEKEEMKIEWAATLASMEYTYSQYAAGMKEMERQFDKASAKDLKELGLPPSATKEQIMAVPAIKKASADMAFTLTTIKSCSEAAKTVLKALGGK